MSEVEKLKQARRDANAAKRAAGGDAEETAPEVEAAEAAPSGPLEQLAAAEEKVNKAMAECEAVTALVAAAADTEALDAAAKRQAEVGAVVGQLTAMMDEVDLGVIEDEDARGEARIRRKAINKRCTLASTGEVEVDGDLAAAAIALRKAVVAKRNLLK